MSDLPTSTTSSDADAPPQKPRRRRATEIILERLRKKQEQEREKASTESGTGTGTETTCSPPERQMTQLKIDDDKQENKKDTRPSSPKPKVDAKTLHRESQAAKKDRTLTYDLAGNPAANIDRKAARIGLLGWLGTNLPSKVKRSEGVGHVLVLGSDRVDTDLIKASEAKLSREKAASAVWEELLGKDGAVVTYDTFSELADGHGLKGGKWIAHVNTLLVDNVWKRVAWSLAYDKFPASCVSASVTPLNDLEGGPADTRDTSTHVIALWNRDYRDEEAVLAAEKALRAHAGIRCSLAYKPDIFSAVGVYRNNEWGLRPALYHSKLHLDEGARGGTVLESTKDPEWKFVVKGKGEEAGKQ